VDQLVKVLSFEGRNSKVLVPFFQQFPELKTASVEVKNLETDEVERWQAPNIPEYSGMCDNILCDSKRGCSIHTAIARMIRQHKDEDKGWKPCSGNAAPRPARRRDPSSSSPCRTMYRFHITLEYKEPRD
jgi:hypothetical protein